MPGMQGVPNLNLQISVETVERNPGTLKLFFLTVFLRPGASFMTQREGMLLACLRIWSWVSVLRTYFKLAFTASHAVVLWCIPDKAWDI